jgi:hypothetical protein
MNTIDYKAFKDDVRNAVLAALDEKIRELLGHEDARGWVDAELPSLFAGVDAHVKAIAARINGGEEPGSATVSIAVKS